MLYFTYFQNVFCILYFNYIFQCNLYLKYNLGQTENKSNLPAMNGCTICFFNHRLYYSESMG